MKATTGKSYEKCKVDACDSAATRVSWGLCEKHHARYRRNGTTDKKSAVKEGSLVHCGGGYLLVYAPNHPLKTGHSPRVYEHRMVYYEHHGEGPFNCYHCGKHQSWDTMHVDHLDGDTQNNEITNLVCSCPTCNQKRGRWKMRRTHQEKSKWMIDFNGERLHVSEWAIRLGISREALKNRLNNWSVERAMTEPRGKTGPRGSNA